MAAFAMADQLEVASLMAARAYAVDAGSRVEDAVAAGCESLRRFGFCVLDNIIPRGSELAAVRRECVEQTPRIERMRARSWQRRQDTGGVAQAGNVPELLFLPRFAAHLGHPAVTGVARVMLDEHVRIAQAHIRHLLPGSADEDRGLRDQRVFHSNWPHDLGGYANGDSAERPMPEQHAGAIR
eukprot:SAG22_NODE_4681_length_1193_cov_1.047532_2_plen_182_part_01